MAARDLQELARRRAARARELAEAVEEARPALRFLAAVFEWQGAEATLDGLVALVEREGPETLREAVRSFDPAAEYPADSPEAFFSRCLESAGNIRTAGSGPRPGPGDAAACPDCGSPAQGGVLRPLAHGDALTLFCSSCFGEWEFPRGRCPCCGDTDAAQLRFHAADRLPHIRTMTCDACKAYLHLIDLSKEPQAVPEVDEIAAAAMDVWALERGYSKPRANLSGL